MRVTGFAFRHTSVQILPSTFSLWVALGKSFSLATPQFIYTMGRVWLSQKLVKLFGGHQERMREAQGSPRVNTQ